MNTRQFILLCRILLAIMNRLPANIEQINQAESLADDLDTYEQHEFYR